jgi:hypothetical protein
MVVYCQLKIIKKKYNGHLILVLLDFSVSPEKNMKNKKYHTIGAFPTATNTNSSILIIQIEILVWFAKS